VLIAVAHDPHSRKSGVPSCVWNYSRFRRPQSSYVGCFVSKGHKQSMLEELVQVGFFVHQLPINEGERTVMPPLDQGIGHEAYGESSIPLTSWGARDRGTGRIQQLQRPYVPLALKSS
ncbi:hypothetical protein HAX54_006610, partial [Datura stramonium]|nr:hypothetical protein [Datura stramonium]